MIVDRAFAADSKAVITVDDEGPGVPQDFRDRIFGRFERANFQDGIGTGLGLAISQEIVQRHDGRIWFEDRVPVGTRFAFSLDILRPEPVPIDGAVPILICEDDLDMANVLREMVTTIGYAAHCVGTAAQARSEATKGACWANASLRVSHCRPVRPPRSSGWLSRRPVSGTRL